MTEKHPMSEESDTRSTQEVIRDCLWGLTGAKPSAHVVRQLELVMRQHWKLDSASPTVAAGPEPFILRVARAAVGDGTEHIGYFDREHAGKLVKWADALARRARDTNEIRESWRRSFYAWVTDRRRMGKAVELLQLGSVGGVPDSTVGDVIAILEAKSERCGTCGGGGCMVCELPKPADACPVCSGTGDIPRAHPMGMQTCPNCKGNGNRPAVVESQQPALPLTAGDDTPWPAHEVLEKLVEAAEAVLSAVQFTHEQYRQLHAAHQAALRYLSEHAEGKAKKPDPAALAHIIIGWLGDCDKSLATALDELPMRGHRKLLNQLTEILSHGGKPPDWVE